MHSSCPLHVERQKSIHIPRFDPPYRKHVYLVHMASDSRSVFVGIQ